ncbi:MAG: OmpH family outer membrane protein [Deltaproteobacteria bacterium]|nr:OmpH family outer membrane protein [Deltaproteobacteria bacterium]
MRLLAVALALALSAPAAAADVKLGFVDLQRALNEVDEGANAKKALKKEFDEKQKTRDAKQNELKALKDELDSRGTMMKPEVKQEKLNDLQKRLLETQQLYFQLQQELSKREGEATAEIFKKMGVILQTLGEEQGFSMIVEKSAVVYAKPSLDVTNELIRRYNDSYGKKAKK